MWGVLYCTKGNVVCQSTSCYRHTRSAFRAVTSGQSGGNVWKLLIFGWFCCQVTIYTHYVQLLHKVRFYVPARATLNKYIYINELTPVMYRQMAAWCDNDDLQRVGGIDVWVNFKAFAQTSKVVGWSTASWPASVVNLWFRCCCEPQTTESIDRNTWLFHLSL